MKPNCNEFGEAEMKRWWRDKDYIGFLKEDTIAPEETLEDIVERVYRNVVKEKRHD